MRNCDVVLMVKEEECAKIEYVLFTFDFSKTQTSIFLN